MAVNLSKEERELIEKKDPSFAKREKVLEVKDLRISFRTDNGKVQAVRGVSFDLYKQETLCIVGESGSGKSVTSKAIMGILSNNAIVEGGSIIYEGEDLLKVSEEEFHRIRGHKIGMIFQDPLSSLNPIVKIGKQITETLMLNSNQLKNHYNDLISKELTAYKNQSVIRSSEISQANITYERFAEKYQKQIEALDKVIANDKECLKLLKQKHPRPLPEGQTGTLASYSLDLDSKGAERAALLAEFKDKSVEQKALKKDSIKKAKAEYKEKIPALKEALKTRKASAKVENKAYEEKIRAERATVLGDLTKKRDDISASLPNKDRLEKIEAEIASVKRQEKLINFFFYFLNKKKMKMIASKEASIASLIKERNTIAKPLDEANKALDDATEKYDGMLKISKSMAKKRALEVMKEVGIPQPEKRYYQYPFQFSGGMRQRIVIAIALTATPDILICDEPTTALDVTIQAQILELINNLKEERHLSCIFITHDLGVVANMADRVAVMYAGKIVEYGTDKEIFFDPRHPYTWALLSSIPDIDSKEKLEAIPGTPPDMIYPPVGDAFAVRNKYALGIDFKYQPPYFKISDTHYAATWLEYKNAPKIEPPKIVTTRIENALKDEEAKLNHVHHE